MVVAVAFLAILGYNKKVQKPDEIQVTQKEEVKPGDNQPKPVKTENTHADILDAVSKAYEKNQDTIGWLKIPDTQIDNSVLQSFNNEYYLRQTEEKKYDVYGCYFLDYECNFGKREDLGKTSIIYGHSSLDSDPEGYRFSQLFKFKDLEFAQNTPYIYYSTQQEYMVWQVMAVFHTDTNMPYINVNLSDEEYVSLVQDAKAKSIYNYADSDYDVATDKLLFLSTCSFEYTTGGNERFVVMAKLVPQDEQLQEKADFAINVNPQKPRF